MSTPEDRAARRRKTWSGAVTQPGDPKGPLYADLSPAERLVALTRLNERAWASVGIRPTELPRSSWPGEIFELRRDG